MNKSIEALSAAVNNEARVRYPGLAKLTGTESFATSHLTRLALRRETPYPYRLVEDDIFYPKNNDGFGRVIHANREEGLAEIHKTISEKQNEHGWLFVPEISSWIDVTQRAEMAGVGTDNYMETYLSYMFDSVEHVHTHPDHTARVLSEEEPWGYSQNYLMEAARLSGDDVIRYVQMAARSSHTADLTSSVVSHHGVTTLSVRDPKNKRPLFTHGQRLEARILEASSDPIADIESVLFKIAANLITYDTEEPVFSLKFAALRSDR